MQNMTPLERRGFVERFGSWRLGLCGFGGPWQDHAPGPTLRSFLLAG